MDNGFAQIISFLANMTDNEVDVVVHSEVSDSGKRKAYNTAVKSASRAERLNMAAFLLAEERTIRFKDNRHAVKAKLPTPKDTFIPVQMAKIALTKERQDEVINGRRVIPLPETPEQLREQALLYREEAIKEIEENGTIPITMEDLDLPREVTPRIQSSILEKPCPTTYSIIRPKK